ncbi:MAG TPA: ABC transporter ATP-binding protein [Mycobacteriales bacterium]|nr:ABC transporter ATP-binding protein [Mycobacteriales bacterium]
MGAPGRRDGDAVLVGTALNLVIEGNQILTDVHLEVGSGEFLAVIGPNGAGKTSLINVLSGAMTPTSGSVRLLGRDITAEPPHRRARAGLGRTFQTSNLLLGRSLRENVRLAAGGRESGFFRSLRPVPSSGADRGRIDEFLDHVGLGRHRDRPASALSHGDRRKLELAIVLAQGSEVILLDEPMAGVNVDDLADLVELIRSVHVEQGRTIVMVEHHMDVVLDLAQRIGVMHHGAMIAVGEPGDIISNETVQTAYMGEPL